TAAVIFIATGCEVSLAVEAQRALAAVGVDADVIRLHSMVRFEAEPAEYIESVLPKAVAKCLSIELGATFGWHRYVGLEGDVLGI
ncbi:transketolase-like TK C-terminal-containing protein, partial [Bacillus cereus]|uniref:transketolase-like TK C-terminal-containing protein n=1 Tax=Bacillus cereus TaxID=1396 RepID=UPI0028501E3E|nr:transketolase [Bacillus cereus]